MKFTDYNPQISQITLIGEWNEYRKSNKECRIMTFLFYIRYSFLILGVLVLCLIPFLVHGEGVRGMYGLPSIGIVNPDTYVSQLRNAGINGVFVPPEKETVKWFKENGYQVYVSVNAFGGKSAWKDHPDSRPVKADGSFLGSEAGYKGHGGVCPTHEGWRKERLGYVKRLLEELDGIDGIWLDFIRYPGLWEVPKPEIPDTCYCSRCLTKFQQKSGITIPSDLNTAGSAAWIKAHCPFQWMEWKKAQIASFVSETRKVINEGSGKRPLKLGLFLVPWTKGERGNAVCYLLGQDPFQLSGFADVISPMVYHRMCGKSPEWVGFMTAYYKETASGQVWPIVQSVDCSAKEFGEAVTWAWRGGADGVLVYSFRSSDYDPQITDYDPQISQIIVDKKDAKAGSADYMDFFGERIVGLEASVRAEDEWGDAWAVPLGKCEPGKEYVFRGEFWRDGWRNGVYPTVSLWGKRFLVNTHLKAKVWQPIRVNVVCPKKITDPNFRFINGNRGTTFKLRRASVERKYRLKGEPELVVKRGFFKGDFFPIGVYGSELWNLEEIKKLAVNTVILGGRGAKLRQKVERCHEVGLRYVVGVPHDPDKLPVFLNEISEYVRPYDLAFYVNDEPGIWSFPVNRANDINRLIKERFPGCATCMAVVRPQVCGDYAEAADFFMLDQYPVPFMPMGWLSDCMGECAGSLSTDYDPQITQIAQIIMDKKSEGRLAAVVQAFGGEKWKDVGWPRLPSEREMSCLAFLSVVNGARGIFFYTYGIMGKTEVGRKVLGRVVGRLNQVYPWLVVPNSGERVKVEMLSENRFDPKGRPAVQCCVKRKDGKWMVIAVNAIGTEVECLISADYNPQISQITQNIMDATDEKVREIFSGKDYVVRGGKIRVRLGAYGVVAFRSTD